jgi:hypothetical protein
VEAVFMTGRLLIGIDIGATRVRVAAVANGRELAGIAVRDLPSGAGSSHAVADPEVAAAALSEAYAELRVPQRSCVLSIGEADAAIRTVTFPKMSAAERERAASFEARRFGGYEDDTTVCLRRVDASKHAYAIGLARTSVLRSRVAAVKRSGLRPSAVDHEWYAFKRAFPRHDGVVDVGLDEARVHDLHSNDPAGFHCVRGGSEVTRGIEQDLSIDTPRAERRKKMVGTAGAGDGAKSELAKSVATIVGRVAWYTPAPRLAFVGNGSRLAGLLEDVERLTGATCEIAVSGILEASPYPCAGAPDWTLAAALGTWNDDAW